VAKSRVTAKYQVTIPREVREKVGLRSGELVGVEPTRGGSILVKRFAETRNPLVNLIGKRYSSRHIPIKQLEEAIESR